MHTDLARNKLSRNVTPRGFVKAMKTAQTRSKAGSFYGLGQT
jgi:hypothetical protein